MLKKLGKRMTNNFGLKLLATLFAIALWIVVINIDDPVITRTFTTSVTPENTSYITALNKYFEVLDGNNTISFQVSGVRSILKMISNTDFSASADMEKIEYMEESESYRVPVTITANRYGGELSISSRQLYLAVVLEDLGTAQKAITAMTRGSVADGCALGDIQITGSNLLKITGPSSIVSQIAEATATINVEGMSADVTDTVVPVLLDAEGNAIDTTKLKLSLGTVTISAQILNTKDVSLEFETMGEVADGHVVTDVEYSLDTVRIKGEAATLNTINRITIPREVLDITDITEDLVTTVDITSYLPEGTALVLSTDAKIEVRVKVDSVVAKSFEVPVENLKLQNLQSGYTASFDADTVIVEIRGAASIVTALKEKEIMGTVDAGGVSAGEHNLAVAFAIDEEHCEVTETVRVPVVIERNRTADNAGSVEDTGNTAGGTNGTDDVAVPDDASEDTQGPENSGSESPEQGPDGGGADESEPESGAA